MTECKVQKVLCTSKQPKSCKYSLRKAHLSARVAYTTSRSRWCSGTAVTQSRRQQTTCTSTIALRRTRRCGNNCVGHVHQRSERSQLRWELWRHWVLAKVFVFPCR